MACVISLTTAYGCYGCCVAWKLVLLSKSISQSGEGYILRKMVSGLRAENPFLEIVLVLRCMQMQRRCREVLRNAF